jgi:excisionase family DNA binding protein
MLKATITSVSVSLLTVRHICTSDVVLPQRIQSGAANAGGACAGGEAGAPIAAESGVAMAAERPAPTGSDPGRLGELKFLTVAEVASLMRVSKMTVYRLVNTGTLPAVRVGRSVRVPEQAVNDYLRDSYVEAI